MKHKVLISAPYMQRDIKKLKSIFARNNIDIDLPEVKERLSEKELLFIIDKYNGVICGDDAFTKKVLDKAKNLKVIVKWGTGIDSIDVDYAKKMKISVYNTPNAFTNPVADTVMAFILCFSRNVLNSNFLMKKGEWEKIDSCSLKEKVLGIIGLGNVGKAVAERANSFGMTILGNDVKKIPSKFIKKYNIKIVSKSILFSKSDYISLNCDLNKESYHLINLKTIKKMKKEAVIINTARGGIIKEKDIIFALRKRLISGVGLDVFEIEPLPKNSALRKLNNVLLSSHSANSSPYYWQKVHENSIKKLFEGLNIK